MSELLSATWPASVHPCSVVGRSDAATMATKPLTSGSKLATQRVPTDTGTESHRTHARPPVPRQPLARPQVPLLWNRIKPRRWKLWPVFVSPLPGCDHGDIHCSFDKSATPPTPPRQRIKPRSSSGVSLPFPQGPARRLCVALLAVLARPLPAMSECSVRRCRWHHLMFAFPAAAPLEGVAWLERTDVFPFRGCSGPPTSRCRKVSRHATPTAAFPVGGS